MVRAEMTGPIATLTSITACLKCARANIYTRHTHTHAHTCTHTHTHTHIGTHNVKATEDADRQIAKEQAARHECLADRDMSIRAIVQRKHDSIYLQLKSINFPQWIGCCDESL